MNDSIQKQFFNEHTNGLIKQLYNPDSLVHAFWLSICLLLLISLLKYFLSKESERSDWGNLVLEYPIDVCMVIITILITGFMKDENMAIGILLIVISLIISVICCICRRHAIKYSYDEKISLKCYFFGLLDILCAGSWIFLIYSKLL